MALSLWLASALLARTKKEATRSGRFFFCDDMGCSSYTMPWVIMASATFRKPAMLAPMTKLPS